MLTIPEKIKYEVQNLAHFFMPQPLSGSLLLDTIYLYVICFIQTSVFPRFFGQYLPADFLTPWLIIIFISHSIGHCLFLGLIGVVILETATSIPAGFYFYSYWILGTLTIAVRNHISWRSQSTWLATFVIGCSWLIIAEILVTLMHQNGVSNIDLSSYTIKITLRLFLALGFGMGMAARIDYSAFEEREATKI